MRATGVEMEMHQSMNDLLFWLNKTMRIFLHQFIQKNIQLYKQKEDTKYSEGDNR